MKKIYLALLAVSISLTAFGQKNMTLVGTLPYPGSQLSNIGGFVDTLGNEYALVGHEFGLSIVDVTNPATPTQVAQIPGIQSIWREVKVWGRYAYVTTEGGGGLQVIDLRNLPGLNLPVKQWAPSIPGPNQQLNSIHALHIDNGFVYLYGSNVSNKGIIIGNLTDPWNPTYAGMYDVRYVHDGYVRNDTVWAGEVYDGYFMAIDVSNKANPVEIQGQNTPNNFTHNTWLSDNGQFLFTTDEVDNSWLAAYDVSNTANIKFMDKIQSQNPGSQSIVHNTHILNDYAISSWYKDGVVITDGHRPQNLVNVGWYDANPLSGGGYGGVWGVYPFLPSGNLVVSDMGLGLFVYTPTYVRACYLEGNIVDSVCFTPLSGVQVSIQALSILDSTDINGDYKTGTPDAGTYSVTFSKPGYNSKTVNGVILANGQLTTLSVQLFTPTAVNISGIVKDSNAVTPVPNIQVNVFNGNNSYNMTTDNMGNYTKCAVIPGNYDWIAGAWGYQTVCDNNVLINSPNADLGIELDTAIYDDFAFNYNWTVSGNAASGTWVRDIPLGTNNNGVDCNPGVDVNNDCSDKCYVTGNAGGQPGDDDVDDGFTTLTSPTFDASGFIDSHISYYRWFYNGGGNGGLGDDTLTISLSNGQTTVPIETITVNTPNNSTWVNKVFKISNFITPTATMNFVARIADQAISGHLVEGGIDKFEVMEGPAGLDESAFILKNHIAIFPNPFNGTTTVSYLMDASKNAVLRVTDITGRITEEVQLSSTEGSVAIGSGYANGMYFVQLVNGQKISNVLKVVKY